MGLFSWNQEEIFSFFAVLIRYSVLFSVLPFVGDKVVPVPVKVLMALAISFSMFPSLVSTGAIRPGDSIVWASTTSGIVGVVVFEALFGLLMGFTAKLAFDAINFGGTLVGHFMGFAAASTYNPHFEQETQVVSDLQLAFAMLIFLAVDGHHLMLQTTLDSYRMIGLGGMGALANAGTAALVGQRLVELTGQVIQFGLLLAAPIAVSMFAVNVAFGVLAKAMPQLNILGLSFAVTALIGLFVIFVTLPEFYGASENILARMSDWMLLVMKAVKGG
jgi:flagellar biosynthetic protein FliR